MAERLGRAVLELATEGFQAVQGDLDKIVRNTRDISTQAQSLSSGLNRLAGTLGVAFSATAVIGFAKGMIDAADATVEMSDKTGIAIEPMQRLQFVAEQSGNSLEQVSSAVSQLQRRLAGGDESATGALDRLGLSFEAIASMSPDEQFLAIAREVGKIEDPMQRAKVATDLFGKAGADLLPTLIANVDELAAQAPVMSERATRAFDTIGDAIDRTWTVSRNFVGEGLGTMFDAYGRLASASTALVTGDFGRVPEILADVADRELPKIPPKIQDLIPPTKGVGLAWNEMDRIGKELTKTVDQQAKKNEEFKRTQDALFGRDTIARANEYVSALGGVGNLTKLSEEKKVELKRAVDAAIASYERLGQRAPQSLREISAATTPLLVSTNRLVTAFEPLKASIDDTGASVHDLASGSLAELGRITTENDRAAMEWARTNGAVLAPSIEATGTVVDDATEATIGWGEAVADVIGNLPRLIQRGLTGGGGLGGALKAFVSDIGSMVGGKLFEEGGLLSGLGDSMTKGVTKLFGSKIGEAFGLALPGIGQALGSLLGPLIGRVGGFFRDLFGGISPEIQQARDDVASFQAELAKAATETQRNEAAMSGWGDRGALTLIRVRDALISIGQSGDRAQELVLALWDTDHPERARAAMEEVNEILRQSGEIIAANREELATLTAEYDNLSQQGTIGLKDLEEAAEFLGASVETLGPAYERQRLADQIHNTWNAVDTLRRGSHDLGTDLGAVLVASKDRFIQLAQEAERLGVQMPGNFRPIFQQLDEAGLLTDEFGNKIIDIAEMDFGEDIASKWDLIADRMLVVADRIQELTDLLSGPLRSAIDSIPRNLEVNVNGRYNPPDIPDYAIPMAEGGLGRVTRPTLFLAGEKGPEDFAFSGANRGFGRTSEDYDSIAAVAALQSEMRGLRSDFTTVLPQLVETASRHAAQTAGRRR